LTGAGYQKLPHRDTRGPDAILAAECQIRSIRQIEEIHNLHAHLLLTGDDICIANDRA
jgi:hypothetical protein